VRDLEQKYGGERRAMNKADKIRLNQRWIREAEEKINALKEEIAVYAIDIKAYGKVISDLEEEDE
jgi:hypothetical protein